MVGVVGESGEVHGLDARVGAQERGNLTGVFHVAIDAQRHRLYALQQ